MNSNFLLEKLEDSEEYKKFIKKNKDAYLCSGFFIIDLSKEPENKYHFDFYVPSIKKTFSFELETGIKLIPLERAEEYVLSEVSMNSHFDFDEIYEIISKEMENKKITNKIQKMLFSLQSKNKQDFLLGTVFLSGLALLKVNLSLSDKKITDFEKSSILDMMKIIKKK